MGDMGKLMLFDFVLIIFIALGLWLVKKYVKRERTESIILMVTAVFTVLFHYSTFLLRLLTGDQPMEYLCENPNLILPIYPCNVVMWTALIFACLKNKKSKLGSFFADYLFWFGIISTLVGMLANVDFVRNPTLADYENVKSIGAHATLLFNVLLLPLFGYIQTNVKRNMTHIVISIVEMAVIGGYCNLLFSALASEEVAYDVNSMFLIHSPFGEGDFLTYPVISLMALPIYMMIFIICDLVVRNKGGQCYDGMRKEKRQRSEDVVK